MSRAYTIILAGPSQRKHACEKVMQAPDGYVVQFKERTRTLDQNAKLWAMLKDLSQQVVWHGRKLKSEDWKHVLTAALTTQDVVPNIDGTGFVVLGQSTSRMSTKRFAELVELAYAFGAEHGVIWTEPVPSELGEAA